jgi:hypothetical protein
MSKKAQYNEKLLEIVEDKKKEWAENIKDLAPLLRSKPEDMTDANALALSYRVMLLEELSYFMNELARENKILKEMRSEKFIYYTTGLMPDGTRPTGAAAQHPLLGNQRLSSGNKDLIISGDLSDFEHTYEILSQMIEFLRECVKTIDQTLYAIKNRLDLFNYLR